LTTITVRIIITVLKGFTSLILRKYLEVKMKFKAGTLKDSKKEGDLWMKNNS